MKGVTEHFKREWGIRSIGGRLFEMSPLGCRGDSRMCLYDMGIKRKVY